MATRVEANLPTLQAEQLDSLSEELEMSKGQIVSEALAFFMKAVAETKLGRRVAIVDPTTKETVTEYLSPALTLVEWAVHPVTVSEEQATAIASRIKRPAAPNAALRRAMSKKK